MLFSILIGEMIDIVKKNKIYSNSSSGCITLNDKKKFLYLLYSMNDTGYIRINNNEYNRISINTKKLEEEDYKLIFENLIEKMK